MFLQQAFDHYQDQRFFDYEADQAVDQNRLENSYYRMHLVTVCFAAYVKTLHPNRPPIDVPDLPPPIDVPDVDED